MNKMREIKIEKVVLSVGGTAEELEKGIKLLEFLTKKKAARRRSRKRIPTLGVRPNLEVGAMVTLRRNFQELLTRFLATIDNQLKTKQISENNFSFGIKEYIEIPGAEYQREIGIRGLSVTVSFSKPGIRVKRKKIKSGRVPARQQVSPAEIKTYMEENFTTEIE